MARLYIKETDATHFTCASCGRTFNRHSDAIRHECPALMIFGLPDKHTTHDVSLPGDDTALAPFIFTPPLEKDEAIGLIMGLRRDVDVLWGEISKLEARIAALEGDGK